MRKYRIWIVAAATVLAAGVGGLWWHLHRQSPAAMLNRLERGTGNAQELRMRLSVARGEEVVALMRERLADPERPAAFRAELVKLLAKRYLRTPDEAIAAALTAALDDADEVVRRQAADSLANYGDDELKANLARRVGHADPVVRRTACEVLTGKRWGRETWDALGEEGVDRVLAVCRKRMETEEDPKLRYLARAVVGRHVRRLAERAREAANKAQLVRAKKLLDEALALDGEHHKARLELVRYHLRFDGIDKAVEVGRQNGALIEVPALPAAPTLDGDPTEEAWAAAWSTDTFYNTLGRWAARPSEGRSRALLGHHGGKLYVAVIAYETPADLRKLSRKVTERDGPAAGDDCAELLIRPDPLGGSFAQICINTVGGIYDHVSFDQGKNLPVEDAEQVFYDRGYWAGEFAVAGFGLDGQDIVDRPIEPGTVWAMNVYRARIGPASEHTCMWPAFGSGLAIENAPLLLFK